MDNPTNNKAVKDVDKIAELGRLKNVYERCCYYDDRVCTGEMTRKHAENALLKMLREEFGIKKSDFVTQSKNQRYERRRFDFGIC